MGNNEKGRLTIRFGHAELFRLNEITEKTKEPLSLLVRTIVADWLQKNEIQIDQLIDSSEPLTTLQLAAILNKKIIL